MRYSAPRERRLHCIALRACPVGAGEGRGAHRHDELRHCGTFRTGSFRVRKLPHAESSESETSESETSEAETAGSSFDVGARAQGHPTPAGTTGGSYAGEFRENQWHGSAVYTDRTGERTFRTYGPVPRLQPSAARIAGSVSGRVRTSA